MSPLRRNIGSRIVPKRYRALRWTREKAIGHLVENRGNPPRDSRKAIEHSVVMPDPATACIMGALKIPEIRKHMRAALGDDFGLRAFHGSVLDLGAVPLDVLMVTVLARLGARGAG